MLDTSSDVNTPLYLIAYDFRNARGSQTTTSLNKPNHFHLPIESGHSLSPLQHEPHSLTKHFRK